MRFDSDKILIEEIADGNLQISFVDQVDGEVTVTTTVDGTDKTVWENSTFTARLDITAAEHVILYEPDTTLNPNGSRVYHVQPEDKTAIEFLEGGVLYKYHFYFADTDGDVIYQAEILDITSHTPTVLFTYPGGTPLGPVEPVQVAYHNDTSRTLTFENTHGAGLDDLSVQTPVLYQDIERVLFRQGNLAVYKTTDGDFMVNVFNDAGTLIYENMVTPIESGGPINLPMPGAPAGMSLDLIESKSIRLTEPFGADTHAWAVSEAGVAIEDTRFSGSYMYAVHFTAYNTGESDYIADIVEEPPGVWKAVFRVLGIEEPVEYHSGFGTPPTYIINNFDNAAGQGYVEFKAVSVTDDSVRSVNATYNID